MERTKTEFDEASHTYHIGKRSVPSVTKVLGDLIPGWMAAEWYLERGRAVHACAAMVARGEEFDHDPQIDGQVAAVRKFFAEVNPVVIDVEKQMFSSLYQFAGTLDLSCRIGPRTLVIDWKASLSKSLPYQLAAYGILANLNYGAGVHIRDDGTYAMTEVYDLRRYKQGFLSLLGAYNVRRECGVKQTTGENVNE